MKKKIPILAPPQIKTWMFVSSDDNEADDGVWKIFRYAFFFFQTRYSLNNSSNQMNSWTLQNNYTEHSEHIILIKAIWNASGFRLIFYSEPRLDFLQGSNVLQSPPYFFQTSITNTRCGQSPTLMLLKVSHISLWHTHTVSVVCVEAGKVCFASTHMHVFSITLHNNLKNEFSACWAFPGRTRKLTFVM